MAIGPYDPHWEPWKAPGPGLAVPGLGAASGRDSSRQVSPGRGGADFLAAVRDEVLRFSEEFRSESLLSSTKELADTVAVVEELSKVVEHLQVIGAHALDRQDIARIGESGPEFSLVAATVPGSTASSVGDSAGSGFSAVGGGRGTEFRDTAEYLRARLGISRSEARRRLRVGASVLPGSVFAGRECPPRCEVLADAAMEGQLSGQAVTLICDALERVRPTASTDDLQVMEEHLTAQGAESDVDILRVIIHRWEDSLDPDGREPSQALLRARQGVFLRGKRYGLHHLNIAATDEQYEQLITTMNTNTNPRLNHDTSPDSGSADASPTDADSGNASPTDAGSALLGSAVSGPRIPADFETAFTSDSASDSRPWKGPAGWDEPTREQNLLEGLVVACRIALSTAELPATGGHRPQVMVTIGYRDLTERLHTRHAGRQVRNEWLDGPETTISQPSPAGKPSTAAQPSPSGWPRPTNHAFHAGEGVFGGLISATAIRKMACDADLIPIVLGGKGQILDVGRAQRLFPPSMRRALIARDRGCAFPDCTIPAPWCEAHHIQFWEHGGPTSTDQGVLLCSRHHHLVHDGNWSIESRTGIPWFIPPKYIDPRQRPRQNRYRHTGPPRPDIA